MMVGWRETPSQLYIYMKIPRPKLDVLEVILGNLEIPDLVHAGFVYCSWRNAYTSLRDLGKVQTVPDAVPILHLQIYW